MGAIKKTKSSNVQSYLSNPCLKKLNQKINFTEDNIAEILKCKNNIVYFIENYVKIVNIDRGFVPFNLYPYQKNIVKTVQKERFVICQLARQSGKTVTVSAILLWYVLFNRDYNAVLLGNKQTTAIEILDKIRKAYEAIPLWLQHGIKEWNKKSIELENGSRIIAGSTSSSAIRGLSVNLLVLDEFAFVPYSIQTEFFNSVYPTISSGKSSKIIIISTLNTIDLYYKMWNDAVAKKNEYCPIKVHWSKTPGRGQMWKKETIKNIGEEAFLKEYECELVGAKNTLISAICIKKLNQQVNAKYKSYLVFTKERDYFLTVYKEYNPEHLYIITIDSAHGLKQDYSAISVFDISEEPIRQVAIFYYNDILPLDYHHIIYKVSTIFKNSMILFEINEVGHQIADNFATSYGTSKLLTVNYNPKKVKYDLREITIFDFIEEESSVPYSLNTAPNQFIGLRITKLTKRIGCSYLKNILEKEILFLEDTVTINEISNYTKKSNDTFSANTSTHDDLVSTLVLFAWLFSQQNFNTLIATLKNSSVKDILNDIRNNNSNIFKLPFILDDGQEFINTMVQDLEETGIHIDEQGRKWYKGE